MSSSRFPGKPLVDVGGVPLVVRSARRAVAAGCFQRVVVATEDPEIVRACEAHGLEARLTPVFPTGTDRVAWTARELSFPFAVNLQGDEPVFPLDLLRDLARLVASDPDSLWTAADLALTGSDIADPDVVKILLGPGDPADALDFHRELPEPPPPGIPAVHVGVYGGSSEALSRFAGLPRPPSEETRKIEPLRALAHGMRVRTRTGRWARAAVDRREHISRVLDLMEGDT